MQNMKDSLIPGFQLHAIIFKNVRIWMLELK